MTIATATTPNKIFAFFLSLLFFILPRHCLSVESLREEGRIHEASNQETLLNFQCAGFESSNFTQFKGNEKSRAIHSCILLRVIELNESPPYTQLGLAKIIDSNLALLEKPETDLIDKLYFEAKFYSELPPGYGQNFARSLLAVESLRRLKPDALTEKAARRVYLIQGNRNRAEEIEKVERSTLIRTNDGESFGIKPALFANSNLGLGLVISAFDDRIKDGNWNAHARGMVSSRKTVAFEAATEKGEFLGEYTFSLSGNVFSGEEDYYGIGPYTTKDQKTVLDIKKTALEVSVRHALWQALTFQLGWKMGAFKGEALHHGPTGAFIYDTRDSLKDSHDGTLISLEGYFPLKDFEKWKIDIEQAFSFSSRAWLKTGASTSFVGRTPPFSELEILGGYQGAPGLRRGRFRDRSLYVGWAEWDHRVWGPLTLGVFTSLGNVAPEWRKLFDSPAKWGGGLSLGWNFSRFRGQDVRIEVARHSGEYLFNVGIGWGL